MCEWEEHAHVYVCVRTAHFFETAAVSNFALYLCNFLLRKTVAACRQLNLPSLPPPPLVVLLQIGNNLLQLQLCLPNCQWKCSTTGAICFMHEQSCTYIWKPVSVSVRVYVCAPINVCGHEGVRVCVCACVCLLAITTIANWQQNIPIAIACPENDDKWVRFSFASLSQPTPSFSFYSPFNVYTSSSVLLHLLLPIYFACILESSESLTVCRKVRCVCVKKRQTERHRERKIKRERESVRIREWGRTRVFCACFW